MRRKLVDSVLGERLFNPVELEFASQEETASKRSDTHIFFEMKSQKFSFVTSGTNLPPALGKYRGAKGLVTYLPSYISRLDEERLTTLQFERSLNDHTNHSQIARNRISLLVCNQSTSK